MLHAAQGHPVPYSESRDWIQVEVQFFFLHTIAILSYVPLRLGMICRDAARVVVCQGQASMEASTLPQMRSLQRDFTEILQTMLEWE